MKKTLLLDVDGVIVDYIGSYLRLYQNYSGSTPPRSLITSTDIPACLPDGAKHHTSVRPHIHANGYAQSLRPYPGAVAAVKRLNELADVYYVTSPTRSKTWAYDRIEWLSVHLGASEDQVISAKRKHLVDGDVFVDDDLSHIHPWVERHPSGIAVVWAHPYNESTPLLRTNDWSLVEELIK